MDITVIPVGNLEANCYVVSDEETGKAIVIDPGDEPDRILDELEELDVEMIVLTHAHFDHGGAIAEIKEATGASIAIHESEVDIYKAMSEQGLFWGFKVPPQPKPDMLLTDGEELLVGDMSFVVVHTPGHSPGSICLYSNANGGVLFTGDTLFAGSVGRTDFPGGSYQKMRESFRKLMGMPDSTAVYSGHGPETTIGKERTGNMFSAEFLDPGEGGIPLDYRNGIIG